VVEIMEKVTVAAMLEKERMMELQEGRLETLAMWLESRFGPAAGESLPRIVGRNPGAAKLARVAELLVKATTFEEFREQLQSP